MKKSILKNKLLQLFYKPYKTKSLNSFINSLEEIEKELENKKQ